MCLGFGFNLLASGTARFRAEVSGSISETLRVHQTEPGNQQWQLGKQLQRPSQPSQIAAEVCLEVQICVSADFNHCLEISFCHSDGRPPSQSTRITRICICNTHWFHGDLSPHLEFRSSLQEVNYDHFAIVNSGPHFTASEPVYKPHPDPQ